jgi:hypothetical protein
MEVDGGGQLTQCSGHQPENNRVQYWGWVYNKNMSAVGVFGFKVGDIFGFRLDQPPAFGFIKDGKAAVIFKKTVYFL